MKFLYIRSRRNANVAVSIQLVGYSFRNDHYQGFGTLMGSAHRSHHSNATVPKKRAEMCHKYRLLALHVLSGSQHQTCLLELVLNIGWEGVSVEVDRICDGEG
jgi:hypothetical protein